MNDTDNALPDTEALIAVAVSVPPRQMTGTDVEALLPLISRLGAMKADPGPGDLLAALSDFLSAMAQLLGMDRAALAALPMHALLKIAEAWIPSWLEVNAGYAQSTLMPMVERLTGALQRIIAERA